MQKESRKICNWLPLRILLKNKMTVFKNLSRKGRQHQMISNIPNKIYENWRNQLHRLFLLEEEKNQRIPHEKLLCKIWMHQRINREALACVDGKKLKVLHPGFLNNGSGPDFKGAIIKFGDSAPVSGDVEVDLYPSYWHLHGHDVDTAYRNVLLHVVWDLPQGASKLQKPTLVIKPYLDSSLDEVIAWGWSETSHLLPLFAYGKCEPCLQEVAEPVVEEILRQAAIVRFQNKTMRMLLRAKQAGWEQALWEGLFRALGYKNNTWPMVGIAEHLNRIREIDLIDGFNRNEIIEAVLFGISGLIPKEIPGKAPIQVAQKISDLWKIWWRYQDSYLDILTPQFAWQMSGIRPANHPHRRIAIAAKWLSAPEFIFKLESWFVNYSDPNHMLSSLVSILDVKDDPFWSRFWTLNSVKSSANLSLLGKARASEIAINVLFPWFNARAMLSKDGTLTRKVVDLFMNWQYCVDNSTIRFAVTRMFGNRRSDLFKNLVMHQGLLQVVEDFCNKTDALCTKCEFPELIKRTESAAFS